MKIVECPYCHKKVACTRYQLMVKGRLSLLCPSCMRYMFFALRHKIMIMQAAMIFIAVTFCAGLARTETPGGLPVRILLFVFGVGTVIFASEATVSWITRPALLQQATDRYVAQYKAEEARKKEAELEARKKQHQHKKKK